MKKIFLSIIFCSTLLSGQVKLGLSEVLKTALEHNHDILKAREEINASKGRFWSGISLQQPEINLSYEFTPLSKSLNNFGEKTFEVSQGFDFPTTYFLRGSKINSEIDAVKSEYKKAVADILSKVKKNYYEVKLKEDDIKIATENFNLAEEFKKKADIRYNAGEGTYLEMLTAKVQRTQALNNLETAGNELKTSLSALLLLMGLPDGKEKEYLLTDSLSFHKQQFGLSGLIQKSESRNPAIEKAKYDVESFALKKNLAWSSLLPSFKFSYSRQAIDGGNNDFYGVGIGASIPLWFLFDQRGQIQEATAEFNASNLEYEKILQTTITSIQNDFLILKNNEREVLLYTAEIIPQAEEVFRNASTSYETGEISYMEYLQAKQILIEARSGYVKSLYKYQCALITLEESTGIVLDEINLNGD
jgi:outer membrane protein, heavy metal efflux system